MGGCLQPRHCPACPCAPSSAPPPPAHRAVINRYGFNSKGLDFVHDQITAFRERWGSKHGGLACSHVHVAKPAVSAVHTPRSLAFHLHLCRQRRRGDAFPAGLLGINLGKNKTTEDAAADYCIGVEKLAKLADYLVINVSSPNTPGVCSVPWGFARRARDPGGNWEGGGKGRRGEPGPPVLGWGSPDRRCDAVDGGGGSASGCGIGAAIAGTARSWQVRRAMPAQSHPCLFETSPPNPCCVGRAAEPAGPEGAGGARAASKESAGQPGMARQGAA